jgi:formate hydrogenlyase subunit 3/multisubunit Na+/H+ antiporter MnhD subunit
MEFPMNLLTIANIVLSLSMLGIAYLVGYFGREIFDNLFKMLPLSDEIIRTLSVVSGVTLAVSIGYFLNRLRKFLIRKFLIGKGLAT